MKRLKHKGGIGLITGLLLVFFTLTSYTTKANTRTNISFEVFYENLAPYGNWINDAEFGFIWAPQVDANFRPYYSNGYWTHTNYGNMWVSNYDWGWAPFHYGRWTHHNRFGWVWVPGYEWGPAWVSWREGGGYYGWAPMAPGISINVSLGSRYQAPSNYWTFVPYRNLYASNVYHYHVANRVPALVRNTTIINNTYVDNRVTYVSGPSSTDVRRRTGATVRTYEVQSTNVRSAAQSRVKGNQIAVYRPDSDRRSLNSATRNTSSNTSAAPGRRTVNSATRNPAVNNNAARTNTTRSTPVQTTRKQPATSPAQQTGTKEPAATRSTRRQSTPKTPATRSTTRKQTPRPAAKQSPQAAPKKATTPSRATRSTRSSSIRSATPVKQNNQRSSGTTRRR